MAFPNPPKTWSAAAVLTAAQMNAELRDALNALLPLNLVAWTSYTPVWTQSVAITKTVTYAKYTRLANLVICQGILVCSSGTGTASNKVTVSLPVTAAHATGDIGSGHLFDASAATNYPAVAKLDSTTTAAFLPASTDGASLLGVAVFTAAVALSDELDWAIAYEV